MSLHHLPDGQGGTTKTLRITGVNVQLLAGSHDGFPNGLGNLILGDNELGNTAWGDFRTGSHNLVMGSRLSYQGDFSIVAGHENLSAYGGGHVLGGFRNASAVGGTVISGTDNIAGGDHSVILTGDGNETVGFQSVIGTGWNNFVGYHHAAIVGGRDNEIAFTGAGSVLVGGEANTIGTVPSEFVTSDFAVLSGGRNRTLIDDHGWSAGSLSEDE